MTFNKVIIAGNLGSDPELRTTAGGTSVASFSLALNRKWKDSNGEDKEEITWVRCTAFDKTAETISEYVKKGDPLLVEGRLHDNTWTDKETSEKRSRLEVTVGTFQFLNRAPEGDREQRPAARTNKPATRKAA